MGGRQARPPRIKTYPGIGPVAYHARRQKNIRLSIRAGEIRVSYPRLAGFRAAEKFLLAREAWILSNKRPAAALADGLQIGRSHRLKLEADCPRPRLAGGFVVVPAYEPAAGMELIKQVLKADAQARIVPAARRLAAETGLQPAEIKLRYMRTQWGSCSARRTVCLNTALANLPDRLVEYVIIHELCHLEILNHGPDFWRLVERHMPACAGRRRELRAWSIAPVARAKDAN